MADVIGKIRALIEADTTKLKDGLGDAEKMSKKTSEEIEKNLKPVTFDQLFRFTDAEQRLVEKRAGEAAAAAAEAAQAEIKAAAAEAEAAQRKFDNLAQGLVDLGAGLTAVVTAPLVLGFLQAATSAEAFAAGMANVSTLIPNSRERVDELSGAVLDLSTQTGKSTTDLTGGLYQIISAFGDTADTVSILDINARAASAGLATTEQAIALTSAVTKGYGDTSAAAVQQVADLAFQTVQLGQTTFPELAGSIGRVVPSAQAMGVEIQELFGFLATFTGVTGSASEVSTQLSAVLTSLMKPSTEMSKAISDLGFESGKAMIEQQGLQGAIELLTASAGGNQEQVGKMFGSVEALRLVLPATSAQSEVLTNKIASMSNATGAAKTAFDEMTQGVNANGFSWQQLLIKVEAIWIGLGMSLQPAITAVLPLLHGITDAVTAAVTWFGTWSPELQIAAAAVAAVAAAIGPLIAAVGAAMMAYSAMLPAITAVSAVIGPMTAGVVALAAAKVGLVAAATAVAAALYWPMIRELIDDISELTGNIKSLASDIKIGLGPQLLNFLGFLKDVVTWVAEVSAQITFLLSPLGALGQAVKAVNGAFSSFREDTDALTASVADNTRKVADHATGMGAAAIEASILATEQGRLQQANRRGAKAAKELTDDIKSLKEEKDRATKVAKFYNDKIQNLEGSYVDLRKATGPLVRSLGDLVRGYDANTQAIQGLQSKITDIRNVAMPEFVRGASQMESAMKALGLTSNTEAAKLRADAQSAYDALIQSGMANDYQKNSAYLKVLQAMAAESKAITGQIPQDLQDSITAMETIVNGPSGTAKVTRGFKTMGDEVSTIVTNLSQDLIKGLFDGDLSFGQRAVNAFKQIGQAAISQFVQPFMNALVGPEGLITKGINVLLDKLGGINNIFGSIFGGASSAAGGAASAAGSVAGAAGQAAGAAGSAASSAGAAAVGFAGQAATAWIGAISGAVSAVADIIGIFQNRNTNDRLWQIEENTRKAYIYLGDNGEWNILNQVGYIKEYMSYVVDDLRGASDSIRPRISDIAANTHWALAAIQDLSKDGSPLKKMEEYGYWSMRRLDQINADMIAGVDRVVTALGSMTVTVVTNLDGKEIARTVTEVQRQQAALQGAR